MVAPNGLLDIKAYEFVLVSPEDSAKACDGDACVAATLLLLPTCFIFFLLINNNNPDCIMNFIPIRKIKNKINYI